MPALTSVLYALLAAVIVGVVWAVTIGSYAAAVALITFLVVLLYGSRDRLP